ncbi:MAG TPA: NrsF family protein [Devosiaceae bacterium]|jgi:hypothetical protein|nr:NrsF family protein [Devosiaceae bacterium]
MKTDNLISAIAADNARPVIRQGQIWALATGAAVLVAAATFFATLGPRPDIAAAATTVHFLFKFVVTIAFAGSALLVLDRLARPGADGPRSLRWLGLAPALLAIGIGVELLLQPTAQWQMLAEGKNSLVCLTYIPLIGLGPLGLLILGLRRGAPTRPGLAGVVAGLVAGGIAASFYAAHCTDDSPLFVATWYTLAVAMLGAAGGIAGRLFARW